MNFSSFCTHINFLVNYQNFSLSISVPQSIHHPEDSRLVQQQRDTDDLYSTRTTRTMFDNQRDTEDVRQPTVQGGRLVRPLDQPTKSSEDQESSRPSTNLTSSRRLDTDLTSRKPDTDLTSRKQKRPTSRRKILINFKFYKISRFFRVVFIVYLSI